MNLTECRYSLVKNCPRYIKQHITQHITKHIIQPITQPITRQASNHAGVLAHNDLESYMKYAATSTLSHDTAQYRGVLYEYCVHSVMNTFPGLQLQRCGRAGDHGVDLTGEWKF
jgi:hypothetical protein